MFDKNHGLRPCAVAIAVAVALGLSGCGGGANVRSSSPPPAAGAGGFAGGDINVGTGQTTVWSNDITGSIDLIKGGAGTLVLAGADSYTGGTTINDGTLQIGNGATTGSIIGDVKDNALLVFDRSNDVTFNGIVSGTGSLTQAGAGRLILTANNTYTGATTISSGTLQLGNGGTNGSISGNVIDNGSLIFDRSDDIIFSDVVSGTGSLEQAGTGKLTLTGDNTYTGGTTISAGTLQLGNGGTTGWIIGDVKDNAFLVFDRSNDVTFNGIVSGTGSLTQAGAGRLILTANNTYSGGTAISSGTLQLGNGETTGSIAGDVTDDGSLVFDHSDDITFSDVVSGSGSLEQAGTGKLTLTGNNTYTGGTTISAGTLQLGDGGTTGWIIGDVTDNGSLAFARGDDVTFNGIVSGSGSLVKSAAGTLTLAGASTYTGGTTVLGGTLEIASGMAGTGTILVSYNGYFDAKLRLDSTASISNHIVLDDGTLDNAGSLVDNVDSATVESGTSSATILNHDQGRIEGENAAVKMNATYSTIKNSSGGSIEGRILGVGLSGGAEVSNDGVGSIISSTEGTAIQISGNSATVENTGGGTISGGTTAVYLSNGGEITNGIGSTIKTTSTDGICQDSGGCSIFIPTDTNNLGKQLTLINAGTIIGDVQMDPTAINFATLSAGSSIQGNLAMGPNSLLTLQGDVGTVELYSHAVTGTTTFGRVSKYGEGTWIIDNDKLDSAKGIGIVVGTLQIGNGGTEGSIGQNGISLYSTLVFDRSDDVIFNGEISGGGGSLVQAGSGKLLLTSSSLSPDHITIESGTLQIGNGGESASLYADVLDNGAFIFDHGNDVVLSSAISGTGSLTQEGSGTLILNAKNTYTGGTAINDGMLQTLVPLPGNVAVNTAGVLDSVSYIGLAGVLGVAGNLSNAGKVMVHGGDSAIGGSYTQSSTGTLAVSLGSKLSIANTATLNGGTLEITGADSGYVSNMHTNVLTAGNGLTGTFAQLVKDAGVVFTATTINYDANSVWLDTTGLDVTTAAAGNGVHYTPVSMGSAQRVQRAFDQLDSKIAAGNLSGVSSDFVHAAGQFQQAPTLQAAQASLQSLSGQLHAASAAMTFEAIDASNRALSDHFDSLLDKGVGYGMWTHNLSVGGDMARTGFNSVGFQLNGWLVGNDRQIGRSGVAGYAFGQSRGQQRLDQSYDHDNSRTTEGMFYAGWLNGNWYTQGRVGFGHIQQDVNRQILLGQSAQGVGTQYNGNYSVAYDEAGLHFGNGNSHITPFVDVQYARINRDGFAEQGAGGFGLQSNAQTMDRWQAGVGLRANRHWDFGGGRGVDFSARAQWQRSLAEHGEVFDASFVGLQQWQPLVGIGLSRYSGLFGMDMNATLSKHTTLKFSYDYEAGQHDNAQTLMTQLNVAF